MTTYTDTDRTEALEAYTKLGTAEAARQTGISPTTIKRWAAQAGQVVQTNTEKTATARAANAARVQQAWGDFREGEALSAGAAASKVRKALLDAVENLSARSAKDLAVVYGILIDKAELLSGNATERVEHWAESEVDTELRRLVAEMEARARGDAPAGAEG